MNGATGHPEAWDGAPLAQQSEIADPCCDVRSRDVGRATPRLPGVRMNTSSARDIRSPETPVVPSVQYQINTCEKILLADFDTKALQRLPRFQRGWRGEVEVNG